MDASDQGISIHVGCSGKDIWDSRPRASPASPLFLDSFGVVLSKAYFCIQYYFDIILPRFGPIIIFWAQLSCRVSDYWCRQ
jgi:hypothetical protein